MLTDLASAFARCRTSLASDFAGATALAVLFVAALYMPGLS